MKQRFENSLSQTQRQHLMFSPQMQRALHLLQLPVMELSTLIEKELEENPVLEYSEENQYEEIDIPFRHQAALVKKEDDDLRGFLESTLSCEISFFETLILQAKECFTNPRSLEIAIEILGNLDEKGFLTTPLDEIALLANTTLSELKTVLEKLQELDPPGICARNLEESLLLQLKRKGKKETLAYKLIENHFDELIYNKIPSISKKINTSVATIKKTMEMEILSLEFQPGKSLPRGHYTEIAPLINPDVFIKGKECCIEVNERYIPSLRINPYYLKMLTTHSLPQETKEYIHGKINSGKWLLRTIDERQQTLYRITEMIVEREKEFLTDTEGKLSPMTMKEVAEKLSLNESTIARAVANKYVCCLRGILPLRSFFTHAFQIESGQEVSVVTLKETLKKLIASEDKSRPYSDETLSKLLNKQGIPLARRTVAKYRDELNIGTVSQRKRH